MSDVKQVKIDNWGNYFLQRLKHFFNRTDYCDLTLQFQDNAQLKVHRLVLSACTEYFELLERTCEMYEDCLIMPEDLQADVVVPIVNFMYTGQLEYRMNSLERLYQTSQIMNMNVLTKLLKSHKDEAHSRSKAVQQPVKQYDRRPTDKPKPVLSSNSSVKRSYSKAFDSPSISSQKMRPDVKKRDVSYKSIPNFNAERPSYRSRKEQLAEPRPTRYELPEELDMDNEFGNSFTNVSYTSEPLMVHPETSKSYSAKKKTYDSNKFGTTSTIDLITNKRSKSSIIFDAGAGEETEIYGSAVNIKDEPAKDTSHLFDQILDDNLSATENLPKVTIETKDNVQASNLDHAKIISEVLKKYPHLVKSNKNIKLKILDTQPKVKQHTEIKTKKIKNILKDFAFQSKVLDSKKAAALIAQGVENVDGPWICLICGTPGKALHFETYYSYRRHLVEVHNEKPVSTICEYCGLKSLKRNYLVYHLYTKHDVEPPKQYKFPKCNYCNYIALTEGLLAKHKLNHAEAKHFWCNHCASKFDSSNQLLVHIQSTGHKYTGDRKTNLQCIYCLKNFLRESNLYTHLKLNHKKAALDDGVIDPSDEEKDDDLLTQPTSKPFKYELPFENDSLISQYEIKQSNDGKFEILSKKSSPQKQNVLNSQLKQNNKKMDSDNQDSEEEITAQEQKYYVPVNTDFKYDISNDDKSELTRQNLFQQSHESNKIVGKSHLNVSTSSVPSLSQSFPTKKNQFQDSEQKNQFQDSELMQEEIVMVDNIEYIIRDNHLIPRRIAEDEFITPDLIPSESDEPMQVITSTQPIELELNSAMVDESQSMLQKSGNFNQPIQIVVSSEEEYKALIASNHPILFNDGSSHKTLTVLTTPQHNSHIKLDSTQSNDMMILPENFPINVSQSVSAENSNIVVVYSHSMDTQNKQQYQIIPQAMETELAQSSADITPTYETVTTSASVVSAHVIETPLDHWQGNDHNNEQVETSHTLQPLNVIQQTVIVPTQHTLTENTNVITDAQLSTEYVPESVEPENQKTITEPAEKICDNTNTVPVVPLTTQEHSQDECPPNMEVDDVPVDKNMSVIQVTNASDASKTNGVDIPLKESKHYESTDPGVATELIEPSVENEQLVIIVENNNDVEQVIENQSKITEAHENVISPPAVDKQIQNLTSEWSEDEYDSSPNAQTKTISEVEIANVEESIENIQQEVDQQTAEVNEQTENVHVEIIESSPLTEQKIVEMNSLPTDGEITESEQPITEDGEKIAEGGEDTLEANQPIAEHDEPSITDDEQPAVQNDKPIAEVETEESADSLDEINAPEPVCQSSETIIGNSTPSREKITSLLNDWEENDSQDESSQKSSGEVAVAEVAEPLSNSDKLETSTQVNDTLTSDDKIKHLVSDWDDDEDEEGNKV